VEYNMNLFTSLFAMFCAIFFIVGSFYIASDYYYTKEEHISKDMAMALYSIKSNSNQIVLPYGEDMVVVVRTPNGVIKSTNLINHPIDQNLFHGTTQKIGNDTVIVGIKITSFGDIMTELFKTPIAVGMFLIGLAIATWIVWSLRKTFVDYLDEELIERLKALRLTIATSKIIPQESSEEAKRIIDIILSYAKERSKESKS
jgi:hypothetical protein